jgi:adenylate kinase
VGKGTQAELLSERFRICALSTGDIFRAAKVSINGCERTPAMTRAFACMAAGKMVPDETVISLLKERVACLHCGGGFLLDGFPRTLAQAKMLEKILEQNRVKLTAVLNYELPMETIIARLSGRRICPRCAKVFHVENRPPKLPGICDDCGAALLIREDDRPDIIRVRLLVYEKSSAPLLDFYRQKGLLTSIPTGSTPEETFRRTLESIKCEVQLQAPPEF